MKKFNLVDFVLVIGGSKGSGVGFGFSGFFAVILGGEEALGAESANVGSYTVAERFASFALDRIAVVEGLSGGVPSISVSVESVDLWRARNDWVACTKVLICLECANEVVVSIFRGNVGAMIGVGE
jgi:hypothetical protein